MIDDSLRLTIDDIFETKYSNLDEQNKYDSKYPVEGYTNDTNMWEFLCNVNEKDYDMININKK